ncbi:MAG: hypothetical protein M0Z31_07620 [Clostridia bacterium]|nr:hypothetical protein [Clostridia bacterium]
MSNYNILLKDLNYLKPVISHRGSNWTEIFPTGQESYILSEGITPIIKKITKGNYTLIPAPLTFNRDLGKIGIGYVVMQKIATVIRLPNYPDRCLIVFIDDSDALCWCNADKLISVIEQAKKNWPQYNLSAPDGEYIKEKAGIYLAG